MPRKRTQGQSIGICRDGPGADIASSIQSPRQHAQAPSAARRGWPDFKYPCAAVEVSDSDQTPAISIAQAPFITASAAPVVWPRSGHFIFAIRPRFVLAAGRWPFDEATLYKAAYAYEQGAKPRRLPPTAPPLPR
jgi:hypothetical protein